MTKEQREQAEDWAVSLAAVLHGVAGDEVAALLRAGIAASEECERAWLAAWEAEWRAQFILPPHKAGLYLNHNEHLCYYETAQKWIEDREAQDIADDWSSPDARQRCIETNEVWVMHWYPQNPVGFFSIAGPTLEEVLAAAREAN